MRKKSDMFYSYYNHLFLSLIAAHIPPIPDPIIATFIFKSLGF